MSQFVVSTEKLLGGINTGSKLLPPPPRHLPHLTQVEMAQRTGVIGERWALSLHSPICSLCTYPP